MADPFAGILSSVGKIGSRGSKVIEDIFEKVKKEASERKTSRTRRTSPIVGGRKTTKARGSVEAVFAAIEGPRSRRKTERKKSRPKRRTSEFSRQVRVEGVREHLAGVTRPITDVRQGLKRIEEQGLKRIHSEKVSYLQGLKARKKKRPKTASARKTSPRAARKTSPKPRKTSPKPRKTSPRPKARKTSPRPKSKIKKIAKRKTSPRPKRKTSPVSAAGSFSSREKARKRAGVRGKVKSYERSDGSTAYMALKPITRKEQQRRIRKAKRTRAA